MDPSEIMEATVYRATMEEMNDFVELTAKVSDMALRCGAVRIDPPPEWNPPPSALLNTSRFFVRTQLLPEAPFVDAQFPTQLKSKSAPHPTPKRSRCKAGPEPSSNPKQSPSTSKANNTPPHPATPPANCPLPRSASTSVSATAHPSVPASDSAKSSHQPASAPSQPGAKPPSVQTNRFCRLTTKLRAPHMAHQAVSPKCGKSAPQLRSQPIAEQLIQNSIKAEPNCATQYPRIRLRSQPVQPRTSAPVLVNKGHREYPPPFVNDDIPIPRKQPAYATPMKSDNYAPQRGAGNSASPSAYASVPFKAGNSSANTRRTGVMERTYGLQQRLLPRTGPHPPQTAHQRLYVPQHFGALPQPTESQQPRLRSQPTGYHTSIAPTNAVTNPVTEATRTPGNADKLDGASCARSLPMSIQPGTTTQATQTSQGSPDTADKVTVVEDDGEESEVEMKMPSIKRRNAKRKRRPNQSDSRAYHQDGDGKLSKPITFSYSEAPLSLKDFKRSMRARLQEIYSLLCADEELQMGMSDEGPEWYRDVDRAQVVFWHAMKKGIAGKPLNVDYGVDVEVEGAFDSNEMSYAEWYGNRTRTKSSARTRKSGKRERVKPKANVNTKQDAGGNGKAKKEPHGSQGDTCPISPRPKRHIRNFNEETLLRLLPRMPGINRSMYYVGQLFTRFCWHTEDAFLNSISYLHEGSAEKVWYAVPPVNAPDFERYASGNVFSSSLIHDDRSGQQLLMNKTTMFDPRDLIKHGVPVYRVVHKPKSFVITAPRAYHAGFNCGFNVAEAVNFANPTWFPLGREAMSFARRVSRPLCIPWEYLLYHEGRKLQETAIPLLAEGRVPPRMRRHAGIVARELERIIREGEEKIQKYAERENVQVRMVSGCRTLVDKVTIGPEYGYNAGISCSICGHASHFYAEVCCCCDASDEARCIEHFGEAGPICDKSGHFSMIVRRHHPVILIDLLDDLERIAGIETSEAEQLKRYKRFVRPWKTPARRSGPVLRIDLVAALSRSVLNEGKL